MNEKEWMNELMNEIEWKWRNEGLIGWKKSTNEWKKSMDKLQWTNE